MKLRAKSREQWLQDLVRKITTNTDITDYNPGSQIATVLEAVATNLFKLNVDLLRTLEIRDIDFMSSDQLDQLAKDIRLPNQVGGIGRIPATQAVGSVTFTDTSFDKISAPLFSAKPAPFIGADKVYLQDAESFPASGAIYIGRGTPREEGPLEYTSKQQVGSYWVLNLVTPVGNNHPYTDLVLLSQGGDRTIPTGTRVYVNGDTPVYFETNSEVFIPDGERSVKAGINAVEVGLSGNVQPNKIQNIENTPFSGLSVNNENSTKSGRDVENTENLRTRIKKYKRTLSRGTIPAITGSLLNLIGEDDVIESVYPLEQVKDEPLNIYINNGSVLEPQVEHFQHEVLTNNASGKQSVFSLKNKPITPAFLLSSEGNFELSDEQSITIIVDGKSYTYTIEEEYYNNILEAKPYEIINNFNAQSSILSWRLTNFGKQIIAMVQEGFERVECIPSELQANLGLPIGERRAVYLYVNGELQNFKNIPAELETRDFISWDLSNYNSFTCIISINGVEIPFNITNSDFAKYNETLLTASIVQWAEVLNNKTAGCEVSTREGKLVFTLAGDGYIEIVSGSWIGNDSIFSPSQDLISYSEKATFVLDRFTGGIQFIEPPTKGSKIEVTTESTRPQIFSSVASSGLFTILDDNKFVKPYMIVGSGSIEEHIVTPTISSQVAIESDHTNSLMIIRDIQGENLFSEIKPGDDFIFVADQDANPPAVRFGSGNTWESLNGIYKVVRIKYDGAVVQQVELSTTEEKLLIVDDLISNIVVTNNMFSSFAVDGVIEGVLLPENTYSADNLVATFNILLINYKTEQVSGKQIKILPTSFESQNIQILKVFANMGNIFTAATSVKTVKDHIAFNETDKLNAMPYISNVFYGSGYYDFQSYLEVETFNYSLLGKTIEYYNTDYPESSHFVSNFNQSSVVTNYALQKTAPYTGEAVEKATEHSYITVPTLVNKLDDKTLTSSTLSDYRDTAVFTSGLNISDKDHITYSVSNDQVKTRLYKKYKINSFTPALSYALGDIISFTLKDVDILSTESDDTTGRPLFDLYHPLRKSTLEGCKLLSRSIAFLEQNGSAVVVKSNEFGNRFRVRLSVQIQETENETPVVSYSDKYNYDESLVDLHLVYKLGTGPTPSLGLMVSGTYSITWGAPVDGVSDVVFDSTIPATTATADTPISGMVFEAQAAGEAGNGITISIVDTSTYASVESGFTGITYRAVSKGSDGNGITIETVDSGSGGLSITENVGAKSVVIDLGGDTVTRTTLKNYTPALTLITFEGEGYSENLGIHGTQITSGGSGTGLTVSEDVFNKIVNIDLGGDVVSVADLQSYLTSNPITLINVIGGVGNLTLFSVITSGGNDADNGPLANMNTGDALNVSGNKDGLPVGVWKIKSVVGGSVTVSIPAYNGVYDIPSVDAYNNPLISYSILDSTLDDIEGSISAFLEDNSFLSVSKIGADTATEIVNSPIWDIKPVGGFTSEVKSLTDAIYWHSIKGCTGGEAAIYYYNPDDSIKAVVKTNNMFPTDEFGTAPYILENEDIIITPDNKYSLNLWINTHNHTTLGVFVNTDVQSNTLNIYNREIGEENNISLVEEYSTSKNTIPLLSDIFRNNGIGVVKVGDELSQNLLPGCLVRIDDSVNTPRKLPMSDNNPFYRNQSIYTRDPLDLKKSRIIFLRRGQYDSSLSESLNVGDTVEFTYLGNGLVSITHTGSGKFSARKGEMLFIPNATAVFPSDIGNTGVISQFGWSYKNGLKYPGYPVVSAGEKEIVIIAPNIISFGSYVLQSEKDLLFIPSLWSKKNIRTHLSEGANQSDTGSTFYGSIKYLSSDYYAMFLSQGDFTTDTLKADMMGVSTGDKIKIPDSFPVEHRGYHEIVAFNKNTIIFKNNKGLKVETQSPTRLEGDYEGSLKQLIVVSEGSEEKTLEVFDKNSIEIGSIIKIPDNSSPWFDERYLGERVVTDFGFISDFTGIESGNPSGLEELTFFVEITTKENAPAQLIKTGYVDSLEHYKSIKSDYSVVKGSVLDSDTNIRKLFLSPYSKHSVQNNPIITTIGKLALNSDASQGIDGYSYFTGLVQLANDNIIGTSTEQGWKAAGTKIAVMPPIPRYIRLDVNLVLEPNVSRKSIEGVVRSAIVSHINNRGPGEDVIISALTTVCQQVTGVISVSINNPEIEDGKIVIGDQRKVVIHPDDIKIK